MNEFTFKQKIIILSIGLAIIFAVFGAGYGFGNRNGSKSSNNSITELRYDLSKLESENKRLTDERDKLISDLSTSNNKLESIRNELGRCNIEFAEQSAENSKRIEEANGNVLEYNRIYTEGIFKLCETMERAIRAIATACGYNYIETQ